MTLTSKQAGKIAAFRTIDEMRNVAAKYDALDNGRVDFRGAIAQLRLSGVDLSQFLFEGANLSGSTFINCCAADSSFRNCVLNNIRIANESGHTTTWENADFSEATISNSFFGPRTLILQGVVFRGAIIRDSKFSMANLQRSDFSRAILSNVELRNADLTSARFVGASLESVCLEKSRLKDTDFTNVQMTKMENWGEPDFTGAMIADDVRYRFAIVANPITSLQRAIEQIDATREERQRGEAFVDAVRTFADDASDAMLIYDEYADVLDLALFVRIVKAAKIANV